MKQNMDNTIRMGIAVMLCISASCHAQSPEMTKPTKDHELLNQFAGDWIAKAETVPMPGQAAFKNEGIETAKMVGGFWLISHGEASMQGTPVNSVMTIGYDPSARKYVGTFLCSVDSTLWKYDGAMDATGKKLTLETEGPSMVDHTKKTKYRETLELIDKDHKTFTSFMQADDGKWVKVVTVDYQRKK